MGQGRENAKNFLRDNEGSRQEIEERVRESLNPEVIEEVIIEETVVEEEV